MVLLISTSLTCIPDNYESAVCISRELLLFAYCDVLGKYGVRSPKFIWAPCAQLYTYSIKHTFCLHTRIKQLFERRGVTSSHTIADLKLKIHSRFCAF
jgi:hypothetical protein